MKPSRTCNVIRKILRAIGSDLRTDHEGLALVQPDVPDFAKLSLEQAKIAWLEYNLSRKRILKNPMLRDKAIEGFLECERKNAALVRGEALPAWAMHYVMVARRICAEIIGEKPNLERVYRNAVFTGGASTSRKRSMAHPALKWWASPSLDVTPLAFRHLIGLAKSCEALCVAWSDPGILSATSYQLDRAAFRIVPGSRFDTVPKDAGTDRTILVEPDGNMVLQRGVGITFREDLRRVGIDLTCQDHNKYLALRHSLDGLGATVDLRNASNTNTKYLCCLILSDLWYELLLELRSPLCLMPNGEWHKLEMISSMGNGFTFELETLLYYCLAKAVCEVERIGGPVSVYGDDIIAPVRCAAVLEQLFPLIGLEVNRVKTHSSGPFRESCGGHYYNGIDVTPFFIKGDAVNGELLRIINSFHSWCTGGDFSRLPENTAHRICLLELVDMLPKELRNQVPLEYANTSGLYCPIYSKPVRIRRNRRGFTVAVFSRWHEHHLSLIHI